MSKKMLQIETIIFIGSFFLFGLFKEYAACMAAGLWGIYLMVLGKKRGAVRVFLNTESLFVGILAAAFWLTCLWGVDRGMSLIGAVRMLGPLFFLGCLMLLGEEERKRLLVPLPWAGAAMTVIGWAAWWIRPLREFFFVADRLGGFFQYPNTYALFCLVGVILLAGRWAERSGWQESLPKLCGIGVLISGIFLSGSRTVFGLLLLTAAVLIVRYRKIRLPLLGIFCGLLAAAVIYAAATGNVQNVGRFLTASLSSSTLLGRIIYVKDGAKQLLSHPLGLGYLGYYYLEPKVQTAFYSVRFIHNDFLQLALDAGLLPGMLFAVVCVKNIISRRLSFERRLILAVMTLHFCMDFDLEFVSMWYLLILLLDPVYGKEFLLFGKMKNAPSRWIAGIVCGVLSCAAVCLGLAMLPRYLGMPEKSSALLPFYTESNQEVLAGETDPEKAGVLAKQVGRQNAYVPEVHDVLAMLAMQRGDYAEMIREKKESLSLQKYRTEAYDRYLAILAGCISTAAKAGDGESVVLLLEAAQEVPKLLKEVEAGTDALAYKTRDVPDFSLSDTSEELLRQVEELLESL